MSAYRPGWMRRDPRRLHAVQHLLPPELWYAATVSPSAGILDRLAAQALGIPPYRRTFHISGRRAGKSAAAAHADVLARLHFTEWTPPPPPEPITREDMLAKLEKARELLASTGYSLEPWQERVMALAHEWNEAADHGEDEPNGRVIARTLRRCADELHATKAPAPKLPPCSTCGYGGWYGSRWHNPEHHAPHLHCGCGRPCSACAAGDGFHRSSPHTTRSL